MEYFLSRAAAASWQAKDGHQRTIPRGPEEPGAWIRLTMFVLGSFLLVTRPASLPRWSHGVWGQGQGHGGPPGDERGQGAGAFLQAVS